MIFGHNIVSGILDDWWPINVGSFLVWMNDHGSGIYELPLRDRIGNYVLDMPRSDKIDGGLRKWITLFFPIYWDWLSCKQSGRWFTEVKIAHTIIGIEREG